MQNKERANELYHELLYDGVNIGAVHADRTKEQRDDVIRRFRTGEVWVLICTDLMSRGMDFKAVNMVINYDFPQSAVSYIHRIGRTGRNGRKGKAVTFFTEDDMVYLRTIANVMKISGCEVPDWMLSLKKARYAGTDHHGSRHFILLTCASFCVPLQYVEEEGAAEGASYAPPY